MLEIDQLKIENVAPISFELEAGACLIVQGISGSGKTLLLRAIADLDPALGRISLNGQERTEMSGPEWRKKVRYAASEPGWWSDVSLDHFNDLETTKRTAQKLGLTEELFERPLSYLSTGERQRLAFLRAIEDQPAVLCLDEPTSSLDRAAITSLESVIQDLLNRKKIIILVTHDGAQTERLATRHLIIETGHARMVC